MSHMHEELEVGHELDMLLRTSMTSVAQLVEAVARRSTDGARATAEQTRQHATAARDRWLEHRDGARAQYGPWMRPGAVENGDRVAAARAWSQAAGWAGQDPSAAQAAPALRDRIGARFGVTPEAILRSIDPDQGHPTGVPAGAMNVPEAVDLAQQYAPSYYQAHNPKRLGPISNDASTPARQQLVGDWQVWAATGQLPRESLMAEWARHTGNTGVLDTSGWRDKDGGVDRPAMHAALVNAWDAGRDQRASEELLAHLRQTAAAGMGTAGIERGTGNTTDQETDYRPMLDSAVLATVNNGDAIAAYGAARVAAQRGEPGAKEAVDQFEQQLSSRWKASPGVYLADAIADMGVARTDNRRESQDVRAGVSSETGQARTPTVAETSPSELVEVQRGVAPSKATTPGERDHRERSWAMARADHRSSLDPDTTGAQADQAWRALADRERYARYWDVYDTPAARGEAPDVAPTRQPATPTPTTARNQAAPAGEQRSSITEDGIPQGRVLELNEQAATWLGERFTPGTPGHAYISDRLGADVAAAGTYRFGYAPPGWRHLSDHLRKNGASDHELIEAGLGRLSSRGSVIDVFRDRVTVAIRDQDGSVLGFVGRDLSGDPRAPKYLNTAQTPAYRKGDVVFGLYEALGATGTGEQPRLARVEGPFDAIAVSAAGQGRIHGVAPLGTELTDTQAAQLAQHAGHHRVWVGNDQDTAGRRATVNDFWRFEDHGLDARLLQWPAGEDPAGLRQRDPDLLRDALAVPDAAPTAGLVVVDEAIREHRAALMAGDADAFERVEITRMDVEQVLRNDVDRDLIGGHVDNRLGNLSELTATEQLHAAQLAAASDRVEAAANHATDPEQADRLHEFAGSLEESEEVARGRAAWAAAGQQREADLTHGDGDADQGRDGQGAVYDRATESDLDNLPDLARRARIASAAGFSQSTNDMLNNTQGPGQAAKPARATTDTGHTRNKSQRR